MGLKMMMLVALCVLPALVSATRPMRNPFVVCGRVYCDTCLAGFETPATTYIQGAKIRVECKIRDTLKLVYSVEGVTDHTGSYEVSVADDHGDQICESVLVSSPQSDCSTIMIGRERAAVFLTTDNGIVANTRFANNLGFKKNKAISGCTQIMQQYKLNNEEDL
ncbi:hypothetical protein GIB67_026032 [Kingdonia uniflora]|uniref:Uncharacterized protein n=1 Tax=Kingdonia uniflora TaxID=39325 RepID=A0A7J7M2V1_9MAGN|nr:hypothetical protein GIB67_026032 [Kingdonia uniflora]